MNVLVTERFTKAEREQAAKVQKLEVAQKERERQENAGEDAERLLNQVKAYTDERLVKDLVRQAENAQQSTRSAREETPNYLTKQLKNREVGDLGGSKVRAIDVAFNDIDVAIPYDRWTALQIDNPTSSRELSKLHAEQVMYFVVYDEERVDANEENKRMTEAAKNVRIDRGRWHAYKEFMRNPKNDNDAWAASEEARRSALGQGGDEQMYDAGEAMLKGIVYNEGQAPNYDPGKQTMQEWRTHLRRHLYRFGICGDVFAEPLPCKGMVLLKWHALTMQARKLGMPISTPGRFLQMCNYVHVRDTATLRPFLVEGESVEQSENWKLYNRSNRFRMEVARLWYKLYLDQEPEVRARIEVNCGIRTTDADEEGDNQGSEQQQSAENTTIGSWSDVEKKLQDTTVDVGMVLAVIERGTSGVLPLGSVYPTATPVMQGKDPTGRYTIATTDSEGEPFYYNPRDPRAEPYTVQMQGDYTWPITKIERTIRWVKFSRNIQGYNRVALIILEALFGDENGGPQITNSFDWTGTPPKALRDNPAFAGSADAYIWRTMEEVIQGIVEAIPVWAQAYLSFSLVDDQELLDEDYAVYKQQQEEIDRIESITDAEKGADGKLLDPNNLRLTRSGVRNAIEELQARGDISQDRTARQQLEQARATFARLTNEQNRLRVIQSERWRDREAASFTWNAYASTDERWRSEEDDKWGDDKNDEGEGTVSWAQTQLHRCVFEIDTVTSGATPPPAGHRGVQYFIGSTEKTPYGQRDMDRKTIVPGDEFASTFYKNWYLEIAKGKGLGVQGQIVTLTNMLDYGKSSETPWYMQVQGQWGTIIENVQRGGSREFTVRVDSWRFAQGSYDTSDVDAKRCTRNGNPIVKVDGTHLWPLSYRDQLRYADIVVLDLPEGNPNRDKFPITRELMLTYSVYPPTSDGKMGVVDLDAALDLVCVNDMVFRNTNCIGYHNPSILPSANPNTMMKAPMPWTEDIERLAARTRLRSSNKKIREVSMNLMTRKYTQERYGVLSNEISYHVSGKQAPRYYDMDRFESGPPAEWMQSFQKPGPRPERA